MTAGAGVVTRDLAGRTALVTGAGRGIGRAFAVRLAERGANVVVTDLARPEVDSLTYKMSSAADLNQTAELVHQAGAEAVALAADVRNQADLDRAVDAATGRFGRLDLVVANAGSSSFGALWELTEEQWATTTDVLLGGAWRTIKAAAPSMIDAGQGGSVVVIGSAVGTKAATGLSHYVAAKHGLVGLMRAAALELAPHSIRVNLVAPGSVSTEMAANDAVIKLYRPDLADPTIEDAYEGLRELHALPMVWADPIDIANAGTWLLSDEARYVTGAVLAVDGGWVLK